MSMVIKERRYGAKDFWSPENGETEEEMRERGRGGRQARDGHDHGKTATTIIRKLAFNGVTRWATNQSSFPT